MPGITRRFRVVPAKVRFSQCSCLLPDGLLTLRDSPFEFLPFPSVCSFGAREACLSNHFLNVVFAIVRAHRTSPESTSSVIGKTSIPSGIKPLEVAQEQPHECPPSRRVHRSSKRPVLTPGIGHPLEPFAHPYVFL